MNWKIGLGAMGIWCDTDPVERACKYILYREHFLLRQVLPKIPSGPGVRKLVELALVTEQMDIAHAFIRKGIDVSQDPAGVKKLVETAISAKQWDMAETLFQQGFDVNYAPPGDAPLIWAVIGHEARIFLIRHGANVPLWFLSYPVIREYIERPWTPENHRHWPRALIAQIRTILVIARGPRKTLLSSIANDLLLYLVAAVAKDHIVIVPE